MTDTRTDPLYVAPEKAMLIAWLDWHRATLVDKCARLSDRQLRTRSAPPSTMSLLGLVRHLADVERGWHRRTLEGADASGLFHDEANPDGEFDLVDTADVAGEESRKVFQSGLGRWCCLVRWLSRDADSRRRQKVKKSPAVQRLRTHRGQRFSLSKPLARACSSR